MWTTIPALVLPLEIFSLVEHLVRLDTTALYSLDAHVRSPSCPDPIAFCSLGCDHGGTCVLPNLCSCGNSGYSGSSCSIRTEVYRVVLMMQRCVTLLVCTMRRALDLIYVTAVLNLLEHSAKHLGKGHRMNFIRWCCMCEANALRWLHTDNQRMKFIP